MAAQVKNPLLLQTKRRSVLNQTFFRYKENTILNYFFLPFD